MTQIDPTGLSAAPCHGDVAEIASGRIIAVCTSQGGVPKRPLDSAAVTPDGIEGDRHEHQKHVRPDRALSLLDEEILRDLVTEGFPLEPGTAGENLTVSGLMVQRMSPGTILEAGDVLIRLEAPRKPCYVLDKIDPRLKEAIVGRCGYMASVLKGGVLKPGTMIRRLPAHGPADGQPSANCDIASRAFSAIAE